MEPAPYPAHSSPAPVVPESPSQHPKADDGIDVTLVRWSLSLTPKERLDVLQANADALARFQDAASTQR